MIGELLVLIGMGFFLWVFVELAKRASDSNKSKKNTLLIAHCLLGIAFILVGRFIVK